MDTERGSGLYSASHSEGRMGKAISYCYVCSARLQDDDFDRGKAVRVEDRVACRGCAPGGTVASPAHSPGSRPGNPPAPSPPTAPGLRTAPGVPRGSSTALPPTNRLPWIVAWGVAALGLAIAAVVLA